MEKSNNVTRAFIRSESYYIRIEQVGEMVARGRNEEIKRNKGYRQIEAVGDWSSCM